jgi:uncharacterized 2Fe-2S/4Fe-4S cluster protein (DUF4445 family)
MMKKVLFPNQNKEILCQENDTVAAACSSLGYPLDLVCGGKGTCKKCTVEIERDGIRQEVLACQEPVSDGLIVYLKYEDYKHEASILTDRIETELNIDPPVKKIFIDKKFLKTPFYYGDWEHIQATISFRIDTPALCLLQKLSMLMQKQEMTGITLVLRDEQLLDIEQGDTSASNYGFAVDLGSTSVVAYLYDLNSGKKVGVYSALNGQITEGADVISRIMVAINNPEGLKILQRKVVETINTLILEAIQQNRISAENIYTMVICGNSAMQHLFLGLHPGSLGRTPYTNTILNEVLTAARELSLNIHPNAVIDFLPLIGGFVGADTLAVLLALPERERQGNRLIIDLGTNGEILLGNEQKWLATSTAAGPALEGATIRFGMRGTNGAIERVKLSEGKIKLKVIGGEQPKGICGSGIVDAVAEMLKAELISKEGRLLPPDKYLKVCRPENQRFADYLAKIDGVSVFYLMDEGHNDNDRIYISQKDIRAVQLAKSAIYTGCMLLMKEYGLKGEDLEEILIAGAFGNYIDASSARVLGLFPNFPNAPIRSIGNAAGAGASNFLLSRNIRINTLILLAKVTHFDLAANPAFQQEYLQNTGF